MLSTVSHMKPMVSSKKLHMCLYLAITIINQYPYILLFQWPYINPLFHKSGESTISKLQNQTTNIETALRRSTASINSSQWNGSINDIWTDSRRNSEAFDLDSSFEPNRKKSKECERICRRLLCAFLAVSIIGAIMTGIGLTLVSEYLQHHWCDYDWNRTDTC